MSKEILLYSTELNPRIEYIFKLIFKDLLNFSTIIFFDNPIDFKNRPAEIKISYGIFFDESILFFAKEK